MRRYSLTLSLYCKAIMRSVAMRVFQHIQKVIIPFFVYADKTSVFSSTQHAQTVACWKKRFHIPTTAALVFIVIRPSVYCPVFIKKKTVYGTVENLHTIYIECNRKYSVRIPRIIHIVVSTESQTKFAPGIYRLG